MNFEPMFTFRSMQPAAALVVRNTRRTDLQVTSNRPKDDFAFGDYANQPVFIVHRKDAGPVRRDRSSRIMFRLCGPDAMQGAGPQALPDRRDGHVLLPRPVSFLTFSRQGDVGEFSLAPSYTRLPIAQTRAKLSNDGGPGWRTI